MPYVGPGSLEYAETRITELEEETAGLREQLDEWGERIVELEAQDEVHWKTRKNLVARIAELEERLEMGGESAERNASRAEKRIAELEDLCDEWQNRTYEKDRRIADLEAEVARGKTPAIVSRDRRIAELEEGEEQAAALCSEYDARIHELEQQLSACRDIDKELGVLREAVDRTARENARLREALVTIERTLRKNTPMAGANDAWGMARAALKDQVHMGPRRPCDCHKGGRND